MFLEIADTFIATLTNAVFGQVDIFGVQVEWVVLWMAIPMVFFTLYFKFVNVRGFRLALRILKGRYADPEAPGEISQFQALTTALSATIGLGNIAGVAIAISIGGPGATFWMIVIAFFAMSLKFAECTLAVKHRVILPDGSVFGGPMYYLRQGLEEKNWPTLGKYLALSYGLLAIPNMFVFAQVNQAYSQISSVIGYEFPWLFGVGLASVVGLVIIGGIKSIAKVTSRIVPLMCGVYLLATVVILITHVGAIPSAVAAIFRGAFVPEGVVGGVVGVFVIGMRRAVYSTEAGTGLSTIVHAAAKTREPVSQGLAALLEPFVDTVIVCTMTALVIIVTGAHEIDGLNDIQMTSAAFGSVISWFPYVLAACVLMFAVSTIISWSYYMSRVWSFLFGYTRFSQYSFRFLFCMAVIPGGVFSVKQVIDLIDCFVFLITIPNIVGLYFLAPTIKRDLTTYLSKVKSSRSTTRSVDSGLSST